jgi:phosphoribosylformylglycinamidine cyclo-ligase
MISERGIPEEEMRKTFNLGIGFCLVVQPDRVEEVSAAIGQHAPRPIGVVDDTEGVRLT